MGVVYNFFQVFFVDVPRFSLCLNEAQRRAIRRFYVGRVSMRGAILSSTPLCDLVGGFIRDLLGVSFDVLYLQFYVFTFPGNVRGGVNYVGPFTFQDGAALRSVLCRFFGAFAWRYFFPFPITLFPRGEGFFPIFQFVPGKGSHLTVLLWARDLRPTYSMDVAL